MQSCGVSGPLLRSTIQYSPRVSAAAMSHTTREKSKLLARVRRIRGQVEALEAERACAEILQQIAAVRGAVNGLMVEVLEDHIEAHVASPRITSEAERRAGAEELIEVVRTYLR